MSGRAHVRISRVNDIRRVQEPPLNGCRRAGKPRHRIATALGCAIALGACAPPGASPPPAPDSVTQTDAQVTMQRLPCYGTCPVYSVRVGSDGMVVFDGERHVDSLGTRSGRIPQADAVALLRDLEESGFFELHSRYTYPEKECGAYHTDAPRVILTLVRHGRTATVEHDYGCTGAPPLLRRLQEQVDSVAGVARWTRSGR